MFLFSFASLAAEAYVYAATLAAVNDEKAVMAGHVGGWTQTFPTSNAGKQQQLRNLPMSRQITFLQPRLRPRLRPRLQPQQKKTIFFRLYSFTFQRKNPKNDFTIYSCYLFKTVGFFGCTEKLQGSWDRG